MLYALLAPLFHKKALYELHSEHSTVPTFMKLLNKKVLDPNGPYISKFQTILRNVCQNVGNFGILSVVICSVTTAYNNLCRALKYLPKVR